MFYRSEIDISTILFLAGILTVVGSAVAGIFSGSFLGFVAAFASGAVGSAVFFGLARILENQYAMQDQLQQIYKSAIAPVEKKTCAKCGKTYDGDIASCPYCGNRG